MSRSKEMATYDGQVPIIVDGRVAFETRPKQVCVMARAEGYAMVRLPGCIPFVVREKELRSPSPNKP